MVNIHAMYGTGMLYIPNCDCLGLWYIYGHHGTHLSWLAKTLPKTSSNEHHMEQFNLVQVIQGLTTHWLVGGAVGVMMSQWRCSCIWIPFRCKRKFFCKESFVSFVHEPFYLFFVLIFQSENHFHLLFSNFNIHMYIYECEMDPVQWHSMRNIFKRLDWVWDWVWDWEYSILKRKFT